MSDIRVSVQWKSASIFAGEELECIITFENTAQAQPARKSPSPSSQFRVTSSGRERWKESLPQQSARNSVGHTRNNSLSITSSRHAPGALKHHKSVVSAPISTRQDPSTDTNRPVKGSAQSRKHGRSVSIVSIGGDSTAGRPSRHHNRAASLQVLPLRSANGKLRPTSGEHLVGTARWPN